MIVGVSLFCFSEQEQEIMSEGSVLRCCLCVPVRPGIIQVPETHKNSLKQIKPTFKMSVYFPDCEADREIIFRVAAA